MCVSLDRYFAVLHPLRVSDARRRGKFMLAVAWGASFVYCIPQVSLEIHMWAKVVSSKLVLMCGVSSVTIKILLIIGCL